MGDKRRYDKRKTSKKRGYVRYRRELALRASRAWSHRASETRAAQAAERNENGSANEGGYDNANEGNEGEVEESGLVQVQVVADIHMPPPDLQPDSPAQPQSNSPVQPQPNSPVQLQPDSPGQPQPNCPVQPQPDSQVQDPVTLLTSTPHRYSHKRPAKKPPRSPRKPQREAKKKYFRQLWKDVKNSRTLEEDIDDPDGIIVASDDSTSEPTAGLSGFSENNDARPKCQINPLLDIQQMARLQPASSKRISRAPGASEKAAPPPAPAEAPEGRRVNPLNRTILNLDTPKQAEGTV